MPYFYDVIDDPNGHWVFDPSSGSNYAGVCHTALPQKGHTRPGEILFGTDSHTCMAGAFNEFATGIGNTDAGFVMGTGKLLLKVPETMHFRLEGKLQPGVMAKDVILHCIGEIGFDGATYRSLQFDGPGVANLSMDDRMTIANMAIEAGGKNGIFEFDEQTKAAVDSRCKSNGTKASYEPVARDRDEKFVYELRVDLAKLEPTVACHPDPGQRKLARELGHVKLDRAYIGSCTGGKTSDFLEFAQVLRGKRVTIDTFGVPATPEIVHDLQTATWDGKNGLANPDRCGSADDGERRLRGLSGRTGGHFRADEFAAQMHQRDQPEFSRTYGPQGIAGLPRLAGHRGCQRPHGEDHGPA